MNERTIVAPLSSPPFVSALVIARRAALVNTLIGIGYDRERAEEIAAVQSGTADDEVSYDLPDQEIVGKTMTPHQANRLRAVDRAAWSKLTRLMRVYRSTGHAPWKRTEGA